MINIHLHGVLANQFGREPIRLDVDTPMMMFRGLESLLPGMAGALRALTEAGTALALVSVNRRSRRKAERAKPIRPEFLHVPIQKTTDIHLVPEVEGGAEAFAAWIVANIGVSLAVATVVATVTINLAISLVIGAVSQALAPSPDTSGNGNERPEERASFVFNGPVNTIAQGGCIPVVCGECMTGSVVISAGVVVEQLLKTEVIADTPSGSAPDTGGGGGGPQDGNQPGNDGG